MSNSWVSMRSHEITTTTFDYILPKNDIFESICTLLKSLPLKANMAYEMTDPWRLHVTLLYNLYIATVVHAFELVFAQKSLTFAW